MEIQVPKIERRRSVEMERDNVAMTGTSLVRKNINIYKTKNKNKILQILLKDGFLNISLNENYNLKIILLVLLIVITFSIQKITSARN
jgi:hypothetical protein